MKSDYDSLINTGLSKEEIAKISGCEDQEMQISGDIDSFIISSIS